MRDKQGMESHERAFTLICRSLRDYAEPKRSIEAKEFQKEEYDDSALQDTLNTMIQKLPIDDHPITSCKRWCLNVLREKSSGWKSVLTVMVQFADLWIE